MSLSGSKKKLLPPLQSQSQKIEAPLEEQKATPPQSIPPESLRFPPEDPIEEGKE